MNSLEPLTSLLQHQRPAIINAWVAELMRLWDAQYPAVVIEDELRLQADRTLEELAALISACSATDAHQYVSGSQLAEVARDFSADCAQRGLKPKDSAQYLLVLKSILSRQLTQNSKGLGKFAGKYARIVDDVLDSLSAQTFEAYVETRERLIADESQSMRELMMPVVLLWNSVLLMQLVGAMDSARARQFTERLLEAITRHEASVALVDLTSVPVFDSSVARHIVKAVEAAQVLGSRIVMIGVSPEANRSLTKQGSSFEGVISRTTMRAGVAEALRIVGRRIDTIGVGRRW